MTEHDQPVRTDDSRLTRNWNELLQEIRVTETGVQILTGFLLTVPFSQRFGDLTDFQRTLYLVVLAGSVATTALVVAPVAFHRALFRHRARYWLVEAANRCARAGLVMMALTISGVVFLVFDIVLSTLAGAIAFGVALAFFAALWIGSPWLSGRLREPGSSPG
ncbi:MAG: DUF6328 family protein [Marmoricola sp.]